MRRQKRQVFYPKDAPLSRLRLMNTRRKLSLVAEAFRPHRLRGTVIVPAATTALRGLAVSFKVKYAAYEPDLFAVGFH